MAKVCQLAPGKRTAPYALRLVPPRAPAHRARYGLTALAGANCLHRGKCGSLRMIAIVSAEGGAEPPGGAAASGSDGAPCSLAMWSGWSTRRAWKTKGSDIDGF